MIPRRLTDDIKRYLLQFPAVTILGARQVGKTTLVRNLNFDREHIYLDLENPRHLDQLEDPLLFLESHIDKLVIIDEVQRKPDLFKILRGVIDERILKGDRAGHFLLLGSSSIELLNQSSESLAGRIAYIELDPLDLSEISNDDQSNLWLRGGFPKSFLAEDNSQSFTWRENFITTYLEHDIPQFGYRIAATSLRKFWTMIAHHQANLLNAATLARSLDVDGKTVAKYLDLLTDILLVRQLKPYHTNTKKRLVKSPKIYIRDSGLLHNLLNIHTMDQLTSHPICGASWEGFVIENLLRVSPYSCKPYFYRTSTQQEIDLLLELPGGKLWAIEIKRRSNASISKDYYSALEDINPDKAFIVYAGVDRYPKKENIEAISLHELMDELQNFKV